MRKYIVLAAVLGLSLLLSHGAQAAAVSCAKTCGPKADGSFWQIICICKSCDGGGVNCNCGGQSCGNALTGQGGNTGHTGNSVFGSSGFNNPAPGRMAMMMDPVTARQREQLGLRYAFGDQNLAAAADWRSLRYDSQNAMRLDLERMKKVAQARQNFLATLFRYYPAMDITRVDPATLGFRSTEELRAWIDSLNDTAFKSGSIH